MKKNNKVNIAIVGLGRLGKRHAFNLAFKTRHVHLQAACSIIPEELSYAREVLGVKQTYGDYEEMLRQEKDLDGVFLVTSSDQHSKQIQRALEYGCHVFCEKPVSLTIEEGLEVYHMQKKHQDKIVSIGFMRRYDPSHVYVKELIDAGEVGVPYLIRSQTVDKHSMAKFQLQFVKTGGSIFMDYNVHDIDIARWFFNANVQEVYAMGGAYGVKEFGELGDADSTTALCKFDNGAMANVSAFRIAPHGAAMFTEIIGTKKWLSIGYVPAKNLVQVSDEYGSRFECFDNFYERFDEAFRNEAQEYIDCIYEGKEPRASVLDGIYASQVALALKASFDQKKLVHLDALAV